MVVKNLKIQLITYGGRIYMLYTYSQIIKLLGTDRKLKCALANEQIFKIEKGVYSNTKYVSELSVISMKYPNAIFTLNSAFYYHGLTDVIPNLYFIATSKEITRIRDKRVKQKYENSKELELGAIKMHYNSIEIKIYNKERMLIELIRNKNNLPFDFYKEIILNYRKIINELDIQTIQEYAYALPKTNMVLETLQLEIL